MSQWQTGDGFRSGSSAHSELVQSWSQKEEGNSINSADCWAPPHASSFHFDANQCPQLGGRQAAYETPLATRFEPQPHKDDFPLAARLEISNDRAEQAYRNEAAPASNDATPLSRIHDILDVHSPSSRWLEQRGYLEAFKSPNCTLDMTFSSDKGGSKVGAVLTAPDGTRRTVVACEGGATFQRLTGSNGQELVKFLSSGQIVELNPQQRQLA